jgi:hypothetical protein
MSAEVHEWHQGQLNVYKMALFDIVHVRILDRTKLENLVGLLRLAEVEYDRLIAHAKHKGTVSYGQAMVS